jgi:hypothetical protein
MLKHNRGLRFLKKAETFCPKEALRVVRGVDDGPKTDWCATLTSKLKLQTGASWEQT